jgi:hypothetical protein
MIAGAESPPNRQDRSWLSGASIFAIVRVRPVAALLTRALSPAGRHPRVSRSPSDIRWRPGRARAGSLGPCEVSSRKVRRRPSLVAVALILPASRLHGAVEGVRRALATRARACPRGPRRRGRGARRDDARPPGSRRRRVATADRSRSRCGRPRSCRGCRISRSMRRRRSVGRRMDSAARLGRVGRRGRASCSRRSSAWLPRHRLLRRPLMAGGNAIALASISVGPAVEAALPG